jgi:hypothetical protein
VLFKIFIVLFEGRGKSTAESQSPTLKPSGHSTIALTENAAEHTIRAIVNFLALPHVMVHDPTSFNSTTVSISGVAQVPPRRAKLY